MSSRWFWIFLALFFLLFSLSPMFYEIYQSQTLKPERYFELVHNFPTDFNFYLSRIRQGIEGSTVVYEKYTSEPHNGSYIQVLYLLLGLIGGFVRVPWHLSSDVYHVARIVFGFTLIIMFIQFSRRSFVNFRLQLLSFLFAITASSWPKFQIMEDNTLRLGGYMAWWSVMDSLQRITFIPHLVLGQALMIFVFLGYTDKNIENKWKNWLFLGFISYFLGIIFPPGLIFIYTSFVFYLLLDLLITGFTRKKFIKFIKTKLYLPVVVILLSVPSIVYLFLMTSFNPWKRLALLDIIKPQPFNFTEYFIAVGPVLPFGILGLVLALRNKKVNLFPSVSWVLSWSFLLFAFNFFPSQSPLRFSEMVPHLPLGILTVYFIFEVYSYFTKLILNEKSNQNIFSSSKLKSYQNNIFTKAVYVFLPQMFRPFLTAFNGINNQSKPVLIALYLLLGIVFSYFCLNIFYMHSSYLWQRDFVDHKIRATYPLVPQGSYVMYPLKDFVNAIVFIQDNSKRSDIVLSEINTGNYIPVYSGNTVYIGHDNTVDLETKKLFVKAFFRGVMKKEEALEFLTSENISFVFYGPLEKEDGGYGDMKTIYPYLEKVFSNDYIIIYKINK